MSVERRCGTCRHLDVPPNKNGAIRPHHTKAYRCMFMVVMPPLPDSITRSYCWQSPVPSSAMGPADGANCPTWERRA